MQSIDYMNIEAVHTIRLVDGWSPERLRALLNGSRKVVLVAHTNADGDAVGSVTGMYALLREALGHEVTLTPMLPDGCPEDLAWLPNTSYILNSQKEPERCREAIAEADVVMGMDLNGFDRTGVLAEWLWGSAAKKVLLDHHIGPDRERFDLVVSDPDISSTCELVYWTMLATYGKDVFTPEAATSLFTGLCTDTGTFAYSNRQASLYLAAAELSQMGIDPMDINRKIKNVFTPNRLKFFGHAMSELLTVYDREGVALMVIRREDMERYGVESHELTGLVNEVMKLRDTDCAILVREEEGKVRLSLRSKCHTDVNRLAGELFGGGGHERAAGATSMLSLKETVEVVKRKLRLLTLVLPLALTLASCHDVPVVDVAKPKGDTLKENMMNANRYIAHSEETQIDSYVQRRGWTMEKLSGGVRVMETERKSGGKAINYEDTVTMRYSVEAINGTPVYSDVEETIVAGRMQPNAGLDAALRTLKEGSKARVIVPSHQAYGVAGDGNRVKSRMILVYNLEVERVIKN